VLLVTYINSRGRHVSGESAYLTPNVLSRPNLKVAIHTRVTRILFDTAEGKPKAVGVEFGNTREGPRFRSRARKEVIAWCVKMHAYEIASLSFFFKRWSHPHTSGNRKHNSLSCVLFELRFRY
jgi:choline dehydrogenase